MADRMSDARSASLSALLSAVAGTRRDVATARFDEELAAAEASGAIDPAVARTLRWWQRETVRGVEEHLQAVLPGLLSGLEAADREAEEAVAASAESWAAASGGTLGRPLPPRPPDDSGPDLPPAPPAPPGGPGPTPTGGSPYGSGTPHLWPVDRLAEDSPGPGASISPLLRPGFAPPEPPTAPQAARPVVHDSPEGGAPPPRLLVGGLTVLRDGAALDSTLDRSSHDRTSTPRDDASGSTR